MAMHRDEVLAILAKYQDEIRGFEVKSLAIFGSVARNEARPDSDVDILVDFSGAVTFDRYMDLKFFLEDRLGRRVDLVTLPSLKPLIRPSVEREAIYVS